MIGRGDGLSATSTCGVKGAERYCILSTLGSPPVSCPICNIKGVEDRYRYHHIKNVITDMRGWDKFWWQSENGLANVSIRLDLEAEFLVTHVIMVFQTFRPAAMFIEMSQDYGKTWKTVEYYSSSCEKDFPRIPTGRRSKLNEATCLSQYSAETPSSHGEVIYKALPTNLLIRDPFADEVLDHIKATNIRVNFIRLHKFGDETDEKYYYAIANMKIHGTCSCYGHASRCLPNANQEIVPGMVYGNCDCKHHTKPPNCRVCEDFYWDVPWRPARGEQINECKSK